MTKIFQVPNKQKLILTPDQIIEKEKMRKDRDDLALNSNKENEKYKHLSNDFKEIMDFLGDDLPRPDSYHLIVKIFNKPEKTGYLLNTDKSRDADCYASMAGLVLAMGPDCYSSEKFKNWNKRSVGEWVIFVPGEGTLFKCKGMYLRFISDDRIFCKTNNPELITRT